MRNVQSILLQKPFKAGRVGLPRTKDHLLKLENFKLVDGKYSVKTLDESNKSVVQQFMLDTFYSLAPVPAALKLYDGGQGQVCEFLKDEISVYCDQGMASGIFHGDKVVGAGWNLYFPRSQHLGDYINAESWLNSAAHLAHVNKEPAHCWRHYQFLHLQHFCEHIIQKYDAKFGLHMSLLAFHEDYRGKDNLAKHLIGALVGRVLNDGGVVTTVGNFPSFVKFWTQEFSSAAVEDFVRYDQLDLTINNEKTFHKLSRLDGITYMSVSNKSIRL